MDVAALCDPGIQEIGVSRDRTADAPWAPGTELDCTVVSADSHFEITDDIFKDALPKDLRSKAPLVWFDGFWRVGDPATQSFTNFAYEYRIKHSCEGLYRWDLREENLRATGVSKEILFAQSVLFLMSHPDYELREACFRIYNEHAAKIAASNPNAVYPVALCPNWWEPEKAKETIGYIRALGLKTFMLPNVPGFYPSGKEIRWGDPELDPFWGAVEESGLPVCFHIIEKSDIDGPGGVGTFMLHAMTPFRKPWAMMVFGGVLDRHPGIKIVYAEGGISWVAPMLQDAELLYDSFTNYLRPKLQHRPTHYWLNNCSATFSVDRLGLEQLHYIGEDNVMWATDYPHTEGTYGYSQHAQQAVLELVGHDRAKKILGGNAIRIFNLEDVST